VLGYQNYWFFFFCFSFLFSARNGTQGLLMLDKHSTTEPAHWFTTSEIKITKDPVSVIIDVLAFLDVLSVQFYICMHIYFKPVKKPSLPSGFSPTTVSSDSWLGSLVP
jgi:hypothetical protein